MSKYEEENHCTYKINDEGERFLLANFTARIKKETRLVDGINTETVLTISGLCRNSDNPKRPHILPDVEVPATTYASLQWVMNAWGVRAVVQPGQGVKDDLRTAIQINSNPEITTIYRHIGWTRIGNEPA